nr:reverse transcriptase domain-containing protein [Tanacetum cinerariifolium]
MALDTTCPSPIAPTSAVRNTVGKGKEISQENLNGPASDVALREYCDKHYNQLLLILDEKMHQEKKRDLRKRLGSKLIRSVSGSPEPRRGLSESPKKRDPERKTVFKRLENDVFQRLGDKEKNMSAYSNDSRHQSMTLEVKVKKQGSSIEDDDLSQPWKKCIKDPMEIHHIKQREGESTEDFICRFKIESRDVKGAPEVMRISGFMHGITNPELIKRLHKKNPEVSRRDDEDNHILPQRGGGSCLENTVQTLLQQNPLRNKKSNGFGHRPLIGFNGEIIWPLGKISLVVKIGNEEHSTSAWMNFVIVRSSSPYNKIIRRPGVKKIQAVSSTAHGMLKFPVAGGILTLKSIKIIPIECELVSRPEGQPSAINQAIEERSRQKKRGQAADRNQAIQEEVEKLVDAESVDRYDDLKEAFLANFLQQKKCIKDPMEIYHIKQREGESTDDFICRFKIESRDVKGAPEVMRISGFIHGITNPELIKRLHEKNPEVSRRDDGDNHILPQGGGGSNIQNHEENQHEAESKKCTFGVEEGMFIGYKVNTKGIKVCPDKADAVLSLSSLKCLKDVQKLNGKLANLNRFLAKSAEKSLPFFKTLKKCTKSDFHWTVEAEFAFKQMKQLIIKLPMLTAPEEKEVLIIYLASAKEAVSSVLMTEREAKQMPIYFVSRALRGPEVNYTSMEKLVLALVHASKQEDSLDTLIEIKEKLSKPWILFMDGPSYADSFEAGLILTNPEGTEFIYALRFRCKKPPGKCGFPISGQPGQRNLHSEGSRHDPILGKEVNKSRAVRRKSQRFTVINGVLYKKSFLGPWLRCVGPLQANYVLREIHEGSCSMHAGPGKVKFLIVAIDYFTKSIYPSKNWHSHTKDNEVDMVQNDEALEINLDLLEERRKQAAIREAKSKAKIEKYYNSKLRSTSFKPGDLVYRSNDVSHAKEGGKLGPKWEGSYEVAEALGNCVYKLRDRDGKQLPILEVYVDDLVIKSRTEDKIIRDIKETFKTMRKINMKLNPKKCTFGVEEGMFIGYKVNTKGIKVCPDKADAVLSLSSLKCLKDVQKLNGKLANLNMFLAKSAEKSLPFFKTLKKTDTHKSRRNIIHLCYDIQENVDSLLVANQVNETYIAKEADMIQYLEKVRTLTTVLECSQSNKFLEVKKKVDVLSKITSTRFAHLSKQVLVKELKEKSINEVEVLAVVEEEGDTLMTLIYKYLTEETLPAEVNKAIAVRRKSQRFTVINEVLYKKSFLGPWLRCDNEVDMVQNDEALEINLDLLEERRKQAAIREAKSKAKIKKYYNSKVRSTSFKPGDLVYHSNDVRHAKEGGKLGPKWEGSYEVAEALGNVVYKLRDRDEKQLP